MIQPRFPFIDWDQPWLVPLRATAVLATANQPWRDAVNTIAVQRQLVNHRGMAIVFAEQSELPSDVAYETFISCTGRVPTRDNLHDFFNALVWLTYPLAKARLNAAQADEIVRLSASASAPAPASTSASATEAPPLEARHATPPVMPAGANVRGVLRDRATVFDENAALLVTSETSVETALRAHDWRQALVTQRGSFGIRCEVRLFGHALAEKLVAPYKAITAHVWLLRVDRAFFTLDESEKRCQVDTRLGDAITKGLLKLPAMVLPVLGVPGWWHAQDDAFYGDSTVFRPKRSAKVPDAQ